MSTPITPDESGDPSSATPPPPPSAEAHPQQYPAPQPYPYPFAPRVREPWINPAKRRTAGLLAAAVALVLLAAGFLAGAVAGDRHDGGRQVHLQQGQFGRQGDRLDPGFAPGDGRRYGPLPRGPVGGVPSASASPSTSSHS